MVLRSLAHGLGRAALPATFSGYEKKKKINRVTRRYKRGRPKIKPIPGRRSPQRCAADQSAASAEGRRVSGDQHTDLDQLHQGRSNPVLSAVSMPDFLSYQAENAFSKGSGTPRERVLSPSDRKPGWMWPSRTGFGNP